MTPPRLTSSRARGLFILGTDTGVGKTAVGAALLRLATRRGSHPIPFKPAETGCAPEPQDALLLQTASLAHDVPLAQIVPFTYRNPVAPAAAGPPFIDRATVCVHFAALLDKGRPILVEGAGGVLSPYAPDLTAADLAEDFQLPVVLVSRNSLGTVNHTALAVAELRRRQLRLLAIVLVNTVAASSPDQESNRALIHALTGIQARGPFPFLLNPTPDTLADALGNLPNIAELLDPLLPALDSSHAAEG